MINKTEKKGFTIIEILITIVLIGLVLGIAIYLINPEKQFARGRNLERMSEIKVIYSAIERYNLVNKKYPDDVLEMGKGINSVKEICATGKIEQGQPLGEINCEGKLDLRVLVPTYVSEIPSDSRSKNETEVEGSGYVLYGTGYMAIKKNDGNLGLYAKVPENGAFLGIGITEEEMQEPPEPTEPSNIMDLTATVNNGEIILTWTEPFNGNSEIIEYQLNYIVGALGFEIILNPANLSYDIGAREYTYTVGSSVEDAGIKDFIKSIVDQGAEINYIATLISKNGIGESQESNQIEVKIGIPDTIENYQANITGSEASITWEKPNMNAGEFVAYKIRYSYDNFESYQEIVLGDVSSHNFNINQNGEIKFVIIAENEYGESTNPTNIWLTKMKYNRVPVQFDEEIIATTVLRHPKQKSYKAYILALELRKQGMTERKIQDEIKKRLDEKVSRGTVHYWISGQVVKYKYN